MKKLFRLWVPVFVGCGVIFYFSSIPHLRTDWGIWDFILRKFAHIIEYLILTFLLYRAFKGSFALSLFSLVFWSFSLSFLYAVFDEIHQAFVPYRRPSVLDVLIDTVGIIIFFVVVLKVKKKNFSYAQN